MVFYEVFSHPELRIYKTTLVSKATLVQLIAICISLLSPFLIAYFTGGNLSVIYLFVGYRLLLALTQITNYQDFGYAKRATMSNHWSTSNTDT